MERIRELLENPGLRYETKRNRDRLIKEKCDLTGFLARFIEGWPDSFSQAQAASKVYRISQD